MHHLSNQIIIVADDLTGATDTASRCFGTGLAARVYITPVHQPLGQGVSAFTSDSRHLAANEAAQAVTKLVRQIEAPADAIWYKKIDSTLRGNLGSELDALMQAMTNRPNAAQFAAPCALICPAFPDQGRGMHRGKLVLQQGTFPEISLAVRLAEQTVRPIQSIDLEQVRQGEAHLAAVLQKAHNDGAQILAVDALTNSDLDQIVAAAQQALPQALYCGSAGLAGALTSYLQQRCPSPPAQNQFHSPSGHNTLVVVGSENPLAREQLQQLSQVANIQMLELQSPQSAPFSMDPTGSNPIIVLHLPPPTAATVLDGPIARLHAAHLGDQALSLWQSQWPRRVIITGGDTAIAVLSRVGIELLTVEQEIMPGIALTLGKDFWGRNVEVILKPGGFGNSQTLVQLLNIT